MLTRFKDSILRCMLSECVCVFAILYATSEQQYLIGPIDQCAICVIVCAFVLVKTALMYLLGLKREKPNTE